MSFDSLALVSGGLDSSVMLHKVVKETEFRPAVLTIDYGQRQGAREASFSEMLADTLNLEFLQAECPLPGAILTHDDSYAEYIPARNAVLFSLAGSLAEYYGVSTVFCGLHKTPHPWWDTTADFVDRMNALFVLNSFKVEFVAPIMELTKLPIIKLGLQLGVNFADTWTCFEGGEIACGECPPCKFRLKSFRELGMEDPANYVVR